MLEIGKIHKGMQLSYFITDIVTSTGCGPTQLFLKSNILKQLHTLLIAAFLTIAFVDYSIFKFKPQQAYTANVLFVEYTDVFYVLSLRTNIGCFYMYLSVMDNNRFHVVFTLHQILNLLKNEHILSNLQKDFLLFLQTFFILTKFSQFFLGMRFDFALTGNCL